MNENKTCLPRMSQNNTQSTKCDEHKDLTVLIYILGGILLATILLMIFGFIILWRKITKLGNVKNINSLSFHNKPYDEDSHSSKLKISQIDYCVNRSSILVTFSPPHQEDPEYRSIMMPKDSTLLLQNRESGTILAEPNIYTDIHVNDKNIPLTASRKNSHKIGNVVAPVYDKVMQEISLYGQVKKSDSNKSHYQKLPSMETDDEVSQIILASLANDAQKEADDIESQYDKLNISNVQNTPVDANKKILNIPVDAQEDFFDTKLPISEPIYENSDTLKKRGTKLSSKRF